MAFIPTAINNMASTAKKLVKTATDNTVATPMQAQSSPPPAQTLQTPQYTAGAKPQLSTLNTPAYQGYDITNDLNSLKTARNNQLVAQLDAKKQAALSNIEAERTKVVNKANEDRNNTSTTSQIGAKNFAEFMANRGSTRDGSANQAEISRNVAYMGALSKIKQQENESLDDILRRETLASNQYASDVASGQAGIDSELMSQTITNKQQQAQLQNAYNQWLYNSQQQNNRDLMSDYRADETMNYNKYRDVVGDNRYANEQAYSQLRDKLADQRYDDTTAYNRGRDTIADNRYADETAYNRNRDTVKDNQWQTTFDYGKERDNVSDKQWNTTFDYNKGRDVVKDNQWRETFDYGKSQDAIKNSQWDKSFNADQGYRNAQLGLEQAKFNWSKSQGSSGNGTIKKSPYYESTSKDLDSMMGSFVENGTSQWANKPGSVEHKRLTDAIENAQITDEERIYLYNKYGIPYKKG